MAEVITSPFTFLVYTQEKKVPPYNLFQVVRGPANFLLLNYATHEQKPRARHVLWIIKSRRKSYQKYEEEKESSRQVSEASSSPKEGKNVIYPLLATYAQ